MIEIYRSEDKRSKTYLVEDIKLYKMKDSEHQKLEDFISYSMRYFKVSPNRLFMTSVWILGDEMFLEDPHKRGSKQKTAICLMNNSMKHKLSIE